MNVTVLYGSETGTAQDVAEEIWKSAKRRGLKSSVYSMDDYDIKKLDLERLIVFVAATTGQGDPPNNMRRFWRFLLRRNLGPTTLVQLKYGVLGLGDSTYSKFNFAAKKLNKRLAQLGAQELQPIGLADEQHDLGIDGVANPWREQLWRRISEAFNVPVGTEDGGEIVERFNVSVVGSVSQDDTNLVGCNGDIYEEELASRPELKVGVVVENRRTTTEDHFQDVRLLKFRSDNLEYEPGDIAYIRPKNSVEQVNEFFRLLNENGVSLSPDTKIKVSEKEIRVPEVLKQTLTLGQVAEQYWDLNFKPRRSTMRTLSYVSENELEKEKLCEFASATGQEELYSYINRPRRNVLEFLADFPHTTSKLNVSILFEIMSPIKPRAFSIASSQKATAAEMHLLVAVVQYKTKLYRPRFGLCSNYLASLQQGDKVMFWVRKGTFKFCLDQPMILVGPGTGVAPFRSLLLERAALGLGLDRCILFFGCRNRDKDYHCREDFEQLKEMGLRLFCAFSRDQERKIYVQHLIGEQSELCWNFLQTGGSVYLAGSSKNMPNLVREEFVRIVKEGTQSTEEDALRFVEVLERKGRYQSETWG